MTEINTNWDQDPYDDETVLGRATAVPVKLIGKPTVTLKPEFGSLQSLVIPVWGVSTPVQLLQRQRGRFKARLLLQSQPALSALPSGAIAYTVPKYGSVTSPGAGVAIAATAVIPAGAYYVTAVVSLAGTVAQGTDNANFVIVQGVGTDASFQLNNQITAGPQTFGPYLFNMQPSATGVYTNNIAVQTINAGTAGSIYSVILTVTPAGDLATSPVYLNSKPDPLSNNPPQGFIMPPGQFMDWESQQPVYAICVGNNAQVVSVQDLTYEIEDFH